MSKINIHKQQEKNLNYKSDKLVLREDFIEIWQRIVDPDKVRYIVLSLKYPYTNNHNLPYNSYYIVSIRKGIYRYMHLKLYSFIPLYQTSNKVINKLSAPPISRIDNDTVELECLIDSLELKCKTIIMRSQSRDKKLKEFSLYLNIDASNSDFSSTKIERILTALIAQ